MYAWQNASQWENFAFHSDEIYGANGTEKLLDTSLSAVGGAAGTLAGAAAAAAVAPVATVMGFEALGSMAVLLRFEHEMRCAIAPTFQTNN